MRRRMKPRGGHDRGLTLLELIVAVAVLSAGTLAVMQSIDTSRRALSGALPRLAAQQAAYNRAGELRLLGATARLAPEVEMGPYRVALTTTFKVTSGGLTRADIRARITNGPGALLVAFLPAAGPL